MAPGYANYLAEECKNNDGQIFIAEVNGKIAGFSCVWIEDEGGTTINNAQIAYFSDLYVKPEFRRKCIATQLIEARKTHAIARGIKKAKAYTLANNSGIHETLKSQGFILDEIIWKAQLD